MALRIDNGQGGGRSGKRRHQRPRVVLWASHHLERAFEYLELQVFKQHLNAE